MKNISIDREPLKLADFRHAWEEPVTLSIGANARSAIATAQAKVDAVVAGGEQVYGLNTGFGQLAHVRISNDELVHLLPARGRRHRAGVALALLGNAWH